MYNTSEIENKYKKKSISIVYAPIKYPIPT